MVAWLPNSGIEPLTGSCCASSQAAAKAESFSTKKWLYLSWFSNPAVKKLWQIDKSNYWGIQFFELHYDQFIHFVVFSNLLANCSCTVTMLHKWWISDFFFRSDPRETKVQIDVWGGGCCQKIDSKWLLHHWSFHDGNPRFWRMGGIYGRIWGKPRIYSEHKSFQVQKRMNRYAHMVFQCFPHVYTHAHTHTHTHASYNTTPGCLISFVLVRLLSLGMKYAFRITIQHIFFAGSLAQTMALAMTMPC